MLHITNKNNIKSLWVASSVPDRKRNTIMHLPSESRISVFFTFTDAVYNEG